jgi:hypothetical protein
VDGVGDAIGALMLAEGGLSMEKQLDLLCNTHHLVVLYFLLATCLI